MAVAAITFMSVHDHIGGTSTVTGGGTGILSDDQVSDMIDHAMVGYVVIMADHASRVGGIRFRTEHTVVGLDCTIPIHVMKLVDMVRR